MNIKVDGGSTTQFIPLDQAGGPEKAGKTSTSSGALEAGKIMRGSQKTEQNAGSSTPDLESPRAGNGNLGEVTAKFLAQQSGGFDMTTLFVELLDVGKSLKTAARLDREAKLNQVESEAKAAAADIRSAAWLSLTATLVSSGAQIAGGAFALKGAAASQKDFTTKFNAEIDKGSNAFQASEIARQSAQLANAPFQFRSTLAAEGGKMTGAFFQLGAQYLEASKTEHQAQSAREQAKADNESDYKQAAEKLIASVLDKMSELQRLQSQTMGNIARMG